MSIHRNILIQFAHPALRRSRVNRRLVSGIEGRSGITVNDLYERYPDFDIDVRREQTLLEDHDVVILQHPFYWYSTPAILKEWQDLVLEHGWAYGHEGYALRGKILMNVLTAGGGEEAYRHSGNNRFTVRELLAPIEQTAALCGMTYLPPFIVYGTHGLSDSRIDRYASDYRRLVEAIRDGQLDPDRILRLPNLNADLGALLEG